MVYSLKDSEVTKENIPKRKLKRRIKPPKRNFGGPKKMEGKFWLP